eukprot:Sspe_Gene.56490::Locus_31084_Transcript_1_1_Confidence_1.000_Length_3036::g.56490::m.56490/K00503/DBH; dopamine beta-monooxygenase
MWAVYVAAVAVLVLRCSAASLGCANGTARCIEVIQGKYAMAWRVDEGERHIEITLSLHLWSSSPWMGVGVSPSGGMKGADILAVHRNGSEWVVSDMFARGYEPPMMDTEQHATLVRVEVSGSLLVAVVRRPLDSCDFYDNAIAKGFPHAVVWAVGEGTDLTHWVSQHVERGTTRVVLWEDLSKADEQTPPSDKGLFDIPLRMPDVEVSAQKNSYVCMTYDLQELTGRDFTQTEYHVVEFAPILAGTGLVHHIMLTTCMQSTPMYRAPRPECPGMDLMCPSVMALWAVGGKPLTLPEAAGLQIGREHGKLLWVQIHYYNPSGVAGVRDSSGLRLRVTPHLRRENAGMLLLGLNLSPSYPPIPPGVTSHLVRNRCAGCLGLAFDRDEVTVIGAMYHAHLQATKAVTYVLRNGTNLGPLHDMKRYDYNHQAFLPPRIPTIARDDMLETVCEYNTMGKDDDTYFGETTNEEMCFSFILYYPRQPRVWWCYDNEWVQGDQSYAPLCAECKGNASWVEAFAREQVSLRQCENATLRNRQISMGHCPPCAHNTSCSLSDYIDFWKPADSHCAYYCSMAHPGEAVPYVCEKESLDRFKSYAAGEKVKMEDLPRAHECTAEPAVRKAVDTCRLHSDCPPGDYCRNGRKAISEAPGLLECTDCTTCCTHHDAVGAEGETDRLYRCPASCRCPLTIAGCQREGEVLCRGCCAVPECTDRDEDGRRLLMSVRTFMNCTQIREKVEAGEMTQGEVDRLCRVGQHSRVCELLGVSQCDGVTHLHTLCPKLCGKCPKCSASAQCSRCVPPAQCSSTASQPPACTPATCPSPSPLLSPSSLLTPFHPLLLLLLINAFP